MKTVTITVDFVAKVDDDVNPSDLTLEIDYARTFVLNKGECVGKVEHHETVYLDLN